MFPACTISSLFSRPGSLAMLAAVTFSTSAFGQFQVSGEIVSPQGTGDLGQLVFTPNSTSAILSVGAACVDTYYVGNIPQSAYIGSSLLNGRFDTSFPPEPVPPGISVTPFSVQTQTSSTSVPTTNLTMTVNGSFAAGSYVIPLTGDSTMATTTIPGVGYVDCSQIDPTTGKSTYTGFFVGDIQVFMYPALFPAVRNNFTSFTASGGPSNSLAPTAYFENGQENQLIPAEITQSTSRIPPAPTGAGLTACQDHLSTPKGGVKTILNCPIATITPPKVAGTSGNFQIAAPPNPTLNNYNPGILSGFSWGIYYNSVAAVSGLSYYGAAIGVSGTTVYGTQGETTFSLPPNCESLTYKKVLYSGSVSGQVAFPNNPEYSTGIFCESFVKQLSVQGSGKFENPSYAWNGRFVHSLNGILSTIPSVAGSINGSDGVPLVALGSIARDKRVIPSNGTNPYQVLLSGTNIGGAAGVNSLTVVASDTGDAFNSARDGSAVGTLPNSGYGYGHFDLYLGVVHSISVPSWFRSPMVLYGCLVAPPAPADMPGIATLCPDTTTLNGINPPN